MFKKVSIIYACVRLIYLKHVYNISKIRCKVLKSLSNISAIYAALIYFILPITLKENAIISN